MVLFIELELSFIELRLSTGISECVIQKD